MRCIVLVICCFFCVRTSAAPLPKSVDPRFADLWAKMRDPNPVMAAVSAYRLSKVPGSAAFLQKQLQVVTATRDETDALLKKLNDGNEEATAEALKEMALFDPRLTHTCAEQIKIVGNDEKLQKLLGVWTAFKVPAGSVLERASIKIDPEPTGENFGALQFNVRSASGQVSLTATSIAPPEKIYNPTLWQHRLALGVLKAAKTKESERLLKAIAEGHERSAITVRAKQLLEPAKELSDRPEKLLNELTGYDGSTWLNLMFALEANPKRLMEAVKLLPTLNLDADKTEALLAKLDSADEAVWKKAMEELAYHQPLIRFDIPSINAKLTTGLGRGRYEQVHNGNVPTENISSFDKIAVQDDKSMPLPMATTRR